MSTVDLQKAATLSASRRCVSDTTHNQHSRNLNKTAFPRNCAARDTRLGSGTLDIATLRQWLRPRFALKDLPDYEPSWTRLRALIAVWKAATRKQRLTGFCPRRIREALDTRDGYTEGMRKAIYDLISEHASHATYRGFQLASKDGLGKLGPFMDEAKLQAWLEEMAKRFGHAAIVLLSDFEGVDPRLDATRAHYLAAMNAWGKRYYGPSFPKGPGAVP